MGRESIIAMLYGIIDLLIWITIVTLFALTTRNLTKVIYNSTSQHRENTTIIQIDGVPNTYEGISTGNNITYDGILMGNNVIEEILLLDEGVTVALDGRPAKFTAAQLEKYRTTAEGRHQITVLIDENAYYLREYTATKDGVITGVNYIKQ